MKRISDGRNRRPTFHVRTMRAACLERNSSSPPRSPKLDRIDLEPAPPRRPPVADAIPPDVRERFRWRTREGEFLRLDQIKTRHMFHALKMCWNHLSRDYPDDLCAVAFTRRYGFIFDATDERARLVWHIVLFILEIDRRGDLDFQFALAYRLIRDQVIRLAGGTMPELPPVADSAIGDPS